MSEHVAIIEADDRGRFSLKKFTSDEPNQGWRVFSEDGGKTITLKAVEAA